MKFTEPDQQRQFVAYTPPQRMEGPEGEAITAGVQTFVTYYKGIKVADVLDGGYNATKGRRAVDPADIKTVRVEFDPESVGLSHAIAANIAPGDPAVAVLRNAMENYEAVNVAIESVRMHRNRETKDIISPLTPIHALMGASTPGGKANMTHAGNTTSRVIAAVNGETTVDCRSDATQWASLADGNRAGNLPPEGFRLLTDKEDWTKVAVAVPVESAHAGGQSSAGAVDIEELARLITDHLDEKMAVENRRYISSPKTGEIAEGKPFSATTMHNWVNLGSFLNSKFRYIFEWSYGYLKELHQSPPEDAEVFALADVVLEIADRAQVKSYGGDVKVDQQATSHTEACRWTQWTIANRFQYSPDPSNEWKGNVCDYVVDKMTSGGLRIAKSVLNRDTLEPPQSAARQQQAAPTQSEAPTESAPTASSDNNDRMENLRRCLEAVNANWNDVDMLRKVYKHALLLNILKAPVALKGGKVEFDRSSSTELGQIIVERGNALSSVATPEKEEVVAQKTVTTNKDNAPVPAPASAPTDEPQDDEPLDDDDFASALGATTDTGDWGERLDALRSSSAAQTLWNQAQSSLNESIEFRGGTVKLGDAFKTVSDEMAAAQEIAEEVASADSVADLNSIRIRAKKANLLDHEVEDGVSDEPIKLVDAIIARRGEVNKGKKA